MQTAGDTIPKDALFWASRVFRLLQDNNLTPEEMLNALEYADYAVRCEYNVGPEATSELAQPAPPNEYTTGLAPVAAV